MSESLTPDLINAKNELLNDKFWPWLIEIQVNDTQAYRITTHDSPITFRGFTWQRFPCKIDTFNRSGNGVLDSFSLTITNMGREIVKSLNADVNNILGRRARIYAVCTAETPIVTASPSMDFLILRCSANFVTATLSLGRPHLSGTVSPTRRYLRTTCGHNKFGDNACGFDRSRSYTNIPEDYPNVSATTCDYGLSTPNGCIAHGKLEEENGFPNNHPLYFGGQPGIPFGRTKL